MIKKDWHIKMLAWREEHVPQRHFILILSFVVGVLASVAANLLKYLIHLIHVLLTESFSRDQVNYWYLLFPAIGILLASLLFDILLRMILAMALLKYCMPSPNIRVLLSCTTYGLPWSAVRLPSALVGRLVLKRPLCLPDLPLVLIWADSSIWIKKR